MEKIELLHLRCKSGCGAPLVITDDDLAECEYCGCRYFVTNMDEILMVQEEEPERVGEVADYFLAGSILDDYGPYDPYFLDIDQRCEKCAYFRYRMSDEGWCNRWNAEAGKYQICNLFLGTRQGMSGDTV